MAENTRDPQQQQNNEQRQNPGQQQQQREQPSKEQRPAEPGRGPGGQADQEDDLERRGER